MLAEVDALSEALTVAEPLALSEALTLKLSSNDNIWLSLMLAESMAETRADCEALRLG